jgi:hypothetical protein
MAERYLGGAFALRFKDKLHLIMGFSAGALIAVAFFGLFPRPRGRFSATSRLHRCGQLCRNIASGL